MRLCRPSKHIVRQRPEGPDGDLGFGCGGLVAPHDHVDIERIDAAADAVGLVASYEGRTGAEERVDDNVAAGKPPGRPQNGCSGWSRKAVRFIVQRLRTSSECRNCTIESTWSAYFDIGNVATSDSKVSSQGALTGRYTRLRSIFGVCAIARSTLPSFGSWGCSQVRAPGRWTSALPIAIPTPEISSTTELALYFSFICRIAGSMLWKSSRLRSTSSR